MAGAAAAADFSVLVKPALVAIIIISQSFSSVMGDDKVEMTEEEKEAHKERVKEFLLLCHIGIVGTPLKQVAARTKLKEYLEADVEVVYGKNKKKENALVLEKKNA